jgi:SPP1 family predicted phage head-tail adaptor
MGKGCVKYLPARMDKYIQIQEVTRVSDGGGGFTESWNTTGDDYASIEPVKAYEKFQASQMEVPISHKMMMRFRDDIAITAKQRILYDDRVFDIKEVINVNEDSAYLKITAIEKV